MPLSSGTPNFPNSMKSSIKPWTTLLRYALITGVIVGGIGELAVLQGWRLRDWLARQGR